MKLTVVMVVAPMRQRRSLGGGTMVQMSNRGDGTGMTTTMTKTIATKTAETMLNGKRTSKNKNAYMKFVHFVCKYKK
jgi:hypothetical protein